MVLLSVAFGAQERRALRAARSSEIRRSRPASIRPFVSRRRCLRSRCEYVFTARAGLRPSSAASHASCTASSRSMPGQSRSSSASFAASGVSGRSAVRDRIHRVPTRRGCRNGQSARWRADRSINRIADGLDGSRRRTPAWCGCVASPERTDAEADPREIRRKFHAEFPVSPRIPGSSPDGCSACIVFS